MTQNTDHHPSSSFLPDNALLAEYLAGRASDTERGVVESWLAQDPRRIAEMELLRAVWSAPAPEASAAKAQAFITRWRSAVTPQTNRQSAFTEQSTFVREERETFLPTNRATQSPAQAGGTPGELSVIRKRLGWSPRRWGWQAAATIMTVLLTTLVLRTPNLISNSSASSTTTYSTRNGERAEITLSDGTRVSLNVGSRIDIPDNFNRGNRTVRLAGEASFNVRHAAGTPFTVTAGPSVTRVLGTHFVVRHYAADSIALVSVRDGKVMMNDNVVLTAMQQAKVSHRGIFPVTAATPGQFTFESGVLTINAISLPDAIPELNRWYDADVRLGDTSLISQQLAGEFAAGSISDLAEILEMTYGVRVVRNGRNLTLFSR